MSLITNETQDSIATQLRDIVIEAQHKLLTIFTPTALENPDYKQAVNKVFLDELFIRFLEFINKKQQDAKNEYPLLSSNERFTEILISKIAFDLKSDERDTLVALIEQGPLFDGDVPSKSARNNLIEKGLAIKCPIKGEDGYQVATYVGVAVYLRLFKADTIAEAIKNRKQNANAS